MGQRPPFTIPVLTLLFTALFASSGADSACLPEATDREKTQLDGAWKFISSNTLTGAEAVDYDDSSWASVAVPHTWDTVEAVTVFTNSWYRTHFPIPDTSAGRSVYVYFEGVFQVADVYVNGQRLGQHRGGYTRFIFDATSAINFGLGPMPRSPA